MKLNKFSFAVLSLCTLLAAPSFAAEVRGEDDAQIHATLVEGFLPIPRVGDLTGSVVSVYAGSAYALETYHVTVGNRGGVCEGDDCLASKTFSLTGSYNGAAQAVYSRQIDARTYSVAIVTNVVKLDEDTAEAKYVKSKILLRVKFTDTGVAEIAETSVVPVK